MGRVSKEIKFVFIAILLLSGCSISVDQTTLDFGSTETEKTFYLKVKGTLRWSIEADKDWVVVEPSEGSQSTSVKVNVIRTGLVEGAYETKLSVRTNGNVFSPIVTVKMSVASTPSIEYNYTEFLPDGWTDAISGFFFFVKGINDNGEVVGYGSTNGTYHGFIYSNGEFTELGAPEGWRDYVEAIAINNNGEVLGNGMKEIGILQGFMYSNGRYTELLPDGWKNAAAVDINDKGEVVGYGENANGVIKGFVYSNGNYTELLPNLWIVTGVLTINNNGEVGGIGLNGGMESYSNGNYTERPLPLEFNNYGITGLDLNNNGDLLVRMSLYTSHDYGPTKSFIYSNGNYKEILPPGLENFEATAINNNGEVIGNGYGGAFIYTDGKYREMTPPAWWEYFGVVDINDYGVITGYFDSNSVRKGFIATPVTK
jgi:probable HAF family extracellular repeat protein